MSHYSDDIMTLTQKPFAQLRWYCFHLTLEDANEEDWANAPNLMEE
jgi:hypothetical protein